MSSLPTMIPLPSEACSIISEFLIEFEEFDSRDSWHAAALYRRIHQWPAVEHSELGIGTNRDAYIYLLEQVDNNIDVYATRSSIPATEDVHIVVANDFEGRLQGILIYNAKSTETSWHIMYLLSSPWNVLKTAERCHGTGTALIHEVEHQAKDRPEIDTITLRTEPTAEEFYTNLGFHKDDPRDSLMTIKVREAACRN